MLFYLLTIVDLLLNKLHNVNLPVCMSALHLKSFALRCSFNNHQASATAVITFYSARVAVMASATSPTAIALRVEWHRVALTDLM